MNNQTIYLAGGCLWGVQAFIRTLNGVIKTEAGRANGSTDTLFSSYDGYVECVKTTFNPDLVSLTQLIDYLFEIIDPYSFNKQGEDVGPKYRTGIYSTDKEHLKIAQKHISMRKDKDKLYFEILPLTNYLKSADEHQDRLEHFPNDYCHIPKHLLTKYKNPSNN